MTQRWLPQGWLDALRQLMLFAGAYYAYRLVRGLVDGQAALAFENARSAGGPGARPRPVLRARPAELGPDEHPVARGRGQLHVRELALRDHDHVPDLALHLPQPVLLLRAQHVHDRHVPGARGLHGLPDRAAAVHARVGLHRHRRLVRGPERRAERQRALQPVRRGAEHARGVRADDRPPGGVDRAPARVQGAVAGLPGRGDLRGRGHRQPLLDGRRPRRRGGRDRRLRPRPSRWPGPAPTRGRGARAGRPKRSPDDA